MDTDELEHHLSQRPQMGHDRLQDVPPSPGVYVAWLDNPTQCLYVGMAGNLYRRIRSHFSGQRGGDQFCLYVCDRYVFPELCRSGEPPATDEINRATRAWIRRHVTFQVLALPAAESREAERQLQRKLQPILNPLPEGGDGST